MDQVSFAGVVGADITVAAPNLLTLTISPQYNVSFLGTGLVYDANAQLTGGVITSIFYNGQTSFEIYGLNLPASQAWSMLLGGSVQTAFAQTFAGNDEIRGLASLGGRLVDAGSNDLLRGYAGNDTMTGGQGADSLFGGTGNDVIYGATGSDGTVADGANYLRGDEGNDTLHGGAAFDDINGNQGNDVAYGGAGNDWVVGGKDDDRLFGDAGDDIVYGNMGNDTLDGGAGNDLVRGGQDNDVLTGGDGNDWLSGDKGADTLTGGLGADTFHSSVGAGLDRVTDFSLAQGDRVVLDRGTAYTLSQIGADTVIDMGGGDTVVLVGVSLSSLQGDWLGVF